MKEFSAQSASVMVSFDRWIDALHGESTCLRNFTFYMLKDIKISTHNARPFHKTREDQSSCVISSFVQKKNQVTLKRKKKYYFYI